MLHNLIIVLPIARRTLLGHTHAINMRVKCNHEEMIVMDTTLFFVLCLATLVDAYCIGVLLHKKLKSSKRSSTRLQQ